MRAAQPARVVGQPACQLATGQSRCDWTNADHAADYAAREEATAALIALGSFGESQTKAGHESPQTPQHGTFQRSETNIFDENKAQLNVTASVVGVPAGSFRFAQTAVGSLCCQDPLGNVQFAPAPTSEIGRRAAPVQAQLVQISEVMPRVLEVPVKAQAAAPRQDLGPTSSSKQGWAVEEDHVILTMVQEVGAKWSRIAKHLPGRSDDSVRNRYLRLRRKWMTVSAAPEVSAPNHSTKKGDMWSSQEDTLIEDAVRRYGLQWQLVARDVPGRSVNAVRNRYIRRHGIEPEPLQVSAMPDAPLPDGTAPHHVPRFGTSPPQPHALPNIDVPNGTANPIIWNLERSATPALK